MYPKSFAEKRDASCGITGATQHREKFSRVDHSHGVALFGSRIVRRYKQKPEPQIKTSQARPINPTKNGGDIKKKGTSSCKIHNFITVYPILLEPPLSCRYKGRLSARYFPVTIGSKLITMQKKLW
jgi:hypothetical protein